MPKSHGHHWWYTYPSKKYESQIGSSSQLLGKINVPNHQPVILSYQNCHCMEYGDPPFSETPKEPDSMSRYLNSASIASFKRCNQKKNWVGSPMLYHILDKPMASYPFFIGHGASTRAEAAASCFSMSPMILCRSWRAWRTMTGHGSIAEKTSPKLPKMAVGNYPFIVDFPMKNGDFP